MRFDVVTFGSGLVDTFLETNLPEKKGFMCYPSGSKLLVKNLRQDIGGGGTNTAVAFSRLGFKTGCICGIGSDINGLKILNLLKKEKVKFISKIKEGQSGSSIVLDSREHERTILTYRGVNSNISFLDIKRFKTKWLCLTPLIGESFNSQKKLAQVLSKKGVKISFVLSEYLIKNINILAILKITDVLVCNKEEAQMLVKKANCEEKDLLKAICTLGVKIVVITDKDRLIYAYDGKNKYSLKPNKVKVVERTGAGDAFASGFVAGQIAGKSIQESLKLGLKESESVIRHIGSKNNLLRMKLK